MSLDKPSQGAEVAQMPAWHRDPEQLENVITLLEAKTIDPKTGVGHWKYGSGHLFDAIFPQKENDWEKRPAHVRMPASVDSFKSILSQLAAGRLKFDEHIPAELAARFLSVMKARGGEGIRETGERITDFSEDKRILMAGLVQYCSFRAEDVGRFFAEKLGTGSSASTVTTLLSRWRVNKEFPFQKNTELKTNSPLAKMFVEELRLLTGMTLQDLRDWVEPLLPSSDAPYSSTDTRLERFDRFITMYERYEQRASPHDR